MMTWHGEKMLETFLEMREWLRSFNDAYINLSASDRKPRASEKRTPQVIASKKAEFAIVMAPADGNFVLRFVWSAAFEPGEFNGSVKSISVSKGYKGKEEIARCVLKKPLEANENTTFQPTYIVELPLTGVKTQLSKS